MLYRKKKTPDQQILDFTSYNYIDITDFRIIICQYKFKGPLNETYKIVIPGNKVYTYTPPKLRTCRYSSEIQILFRNGLLIRETQRR